MDISHPWVFGKWMSKNPNFKSNNHNNNNDTKDNNNDNNNKILRRGYYVKKYTKHKKKIHFGRGGAGNVYSKKSGDI